MQLAFIALGALCGVEAWLQFRLLCSMVAATGKQTPMLGYATVSLVMLLTGAALLLIGNGLGVED